MTTSTTAVVIDDRTAGERFRQHATVVLKSASTWVFAVGSALVSILLDRWAVMSPDQQAGLLGNVGITNPGTMTALLAIITLAVRIIPPRKGTVSPALQDALERIAAEQINQRLVAQGRAPLALPAPKLIAITHEQLAAVRQQAQTGPDHPDDDDGYPETMPPPAPQPIAAPAAAPLPPPPAPAPPMPGTVFMGDMRTLAPTPSTTAADADLAQRLRAAAPWRTDMEVAGAVASWTRPPAGGAP